MEVDVRRSIHDYGVAPAASSGWRGGRPVCQPRRILLHPARLGNHRGAVQGVQHNPFLQWAATPAGNGYLSLFLALIVIGRWLLARKRWPLWPATILLAVMATTVYTSMVHEKLTSLWKTERRGAFHYFFGAKYFRELGYADIYRFSLLADFETGFRHLKHQTEIRDQEDYELVPVEEALEQARQKRPLVFTDKRWEEFKQDWLAISRGIPDNQWERMLTDRGFNPPPFWQVVASPLAQYIDARSKTAYHVGLFADVVLLLAALIAVGICAGLDAALLVFCFLHLAYYYNGSVFGTYFQYVWLDGLLLCMALYRRGKMIASGAALAVGAGTTIFPVVFVAGPGVVFLRELIRTRRIPWAPFRFLASFAAFSLIFIGLGVIAGHGISPSKKFFEKITMHAWHQKFDSNKFGLKRTMSVEWSNRWDWTSIDKRTEIFIDQRHLYQALFVLLAALTIGAMIRGPDEDHWTVPLGQGLIYALMTASRYYYHSLTMFMVTGKDRRGAGFAAFSIASIFLINAGCYLSEAKLGPAHGGDRVAYTFGNYAYLVLFLALPTYLLLKDLALKKLAQLRGRPAPPAPAPAA
jgi:hypothetical protein